MKVLVSFLLPSGSEARITFGNAADAQFVYEAIVAAGARRPNRTVLKGRSSPIEKDPCAKDTST